MILSLSGCEGGKCIDIFKNYEMNILIAIDDFRNWYIHAKEAVNEMKMRSQTVPQ